jgi:hypothetical protein
MGAKSFRDFQADGYSAGCTIEVLITFSVARGATSRDTYYRRPAEVLFADWLKPCHSKIAAWLLDGDDAFPAGSLAH